MTNRQYIVRRPDGESYSPPMGLVTLMGTAAKRVIAGRGPYQLTQDGDPIGPNEGRLDVLARFKRAISNREIGPTFRIRDRGGVVLTGRAVARILDQDTTSGNERADVMWNTVRLEWGEYDPRYAGAYVCKEIAGSNQMSQHSYGNAIDIFFDTLAHQERVADWVVAHADELHVMHVISGRRIWTRGEGWHAYTGDFHSHLHVDFDPQFSGPCGVRGEL